MITRVKRTPEAIMQDRIALATALRRLDKPALLAEINRRARVNGCDARMPKGDLINYLVDLEYPMPRTPRA